MNVGGGNPIYSNAGHRVLSEPILKVVILDGGMGTRLREETEVRPKPMIEIGGRPIRWHIMKLYARHGWDEFAPRVGARGDARADPPLRGARALGSRSDAGKLRASV
jgi:hypothetical protein